MTVYSSTKLSHLSIRFTRDRNTKDKQDVAFTDTEAMYMIFPVKGGTYNGVNKKIRPVAQKVVEVPWFPNMLLGV